MSRPSARHERLGWLLAVIATGTYVCFVAALSFVSRHHAEPSPAGGRLTLAMGATVVFIAALVAVTGGYLYRSRQLDEREQAGADEPT